MRTLVAVTSEIADRARRIDLARMLGVVVAVPFVTVGLVVGALVRGAVTVTVTVGSWAAASVLVGYEIARGKARP